MIDQGHKMELREVLAMAVGAMIGGGIFALLGLVLGISGEAAYLSFLVGGLMALNAGDSFNKLFLHYGVGGGLYTYTRLATGRPRLAGFLSWVLILGYIFTVGLYAVTFGSYVGHYLGWGIGSLGQKALSTAIVVAFIAINLVGVKEAAKWESFLVYGKLVLIALFAVLLLNSLGIDQVTTELGRSFEVAGEVGVGAILAGAALIFVGFEGFQMLTYSVKDIRDPRRTVGRGIYGAIIIVTLAYVVIGFVTSQILTPEQVLANKETVFAILMEPLLGWVGSVLVLIAVIFSTSSAINATMFGTSRLVATVAESTSIPDMFYETNGQGIPHYAVWAVGLLSIFIVNTAGLEAIAAFASIVFILYFALIDYLDFLVVRQGWAAKLFTLGGSVFSLFAIIVLFTELFNHDLGSLEFVIVLFGALTVLKIAKGMVEERIWSQKKIREF